MNRTPLLLAIASVGSVTAFACGGPSPSGPGAGLDADAGLDASLDANVGAVPPPLYPDAGDGGAKAPDAAPDTGDGTACAPGMKACGERCVPAVDPATGCAAADCTPCSFKNAGATCDSAGACAMGTCATGFSDCNTDAKDGCEVDVTTADHCGSCTTACSASAPNCAPSGATYACSTGCPASASTLCGAQCVDLATSASHCGSCANDCGAIANGQMTCAASQCVAACSTGFHVCGATCTANTAPATCGASCTPCGGAPNASATCDGLSCGYACNAGYTDCNTLANDGCEAHFQDDPANCGSCGHACLGGACNAGQCQPVTLATSSGFAITSDSQNVYWNTQSNIYKCATPGGCSQAPTALLGNPEYSFTSSNGLAFEPVTKTLTFAGNWAPDGMQRLTTMLTDGTVKKFLASSSVDDSPIAADSTNRYFNSGTEALMRIASDGSQATILSTIPASAIAVDDLYVYAASPGRVQAYAKTTALAWDVLTLNGAKALSLASDGSNLYVGTDAGSIYRCSVSGAAGSTGCVPLNGSTPWASGQGAVAGLVVDSTYVYWTTKSGLTVARCPKAAASCPIPSVLATMSSSELPMSLTQDAASIYWLTTSSVMMLAK